MPSAVSSTASRINCCDAGSELLTRSTCWFTTSTYRTRRVFRHRLTPKVRKIRFKYTGYPEFRDLTAVIHHPADNSGDLVQRDNGIELLANPRRGKPECLGPVIYIMLCCNGQECD